MVQVLALLYIMTSMHTSDSASLPAPLALNLIVSSRERYQLHTQLRKGCTNTKASALNLGLHTVSWEIQAAAFKGVTLVMKDIQEVICAPQLRSAQLPPKIASNSLHDVVGRSKHDQSVGSVDARPLHLSNR